uniref:Protein kinase domain-containing protein n=1 Tax=viral metagenome TaxID=1070528 RepID=A0A6C0ANM3_9ZZZZ
MALPKNKQGNFVYYGQPEFVDRIINAWKAKNTSKNSSKLKGVYGTVYKVANVNVANTEYYVKQIIPTHFNKDFLGNMKKAIQEIEISNILTASVPDSISNLMGARVLSEELINKGDIKEKEEKKKKNFFLNKDTLKNIIDPELAYSYLIFEGPEGMTVKEAFAEIKESGKEIKESGKEKKERLINYLAIICSAKQAIDAVNSAGYLHYDSHENNIFVIGHGRNARCKLIDFGEAEPIPEQEAKEKYTFDIKNMVFKIVGGLLIKRDAETDEFKRYFSIQIPSDIYQYDNKMLLEMIQTDTIIDEIFSLCGRDDFVEYRFINKYANEQALNNPLIPLETGPHLPPKKGFFRGGYKRKTRRRNKSRRN